MTERVKTTHILEVEGKEAPQKIYADFPPAGESGKRFPVSPGDVDPTNIESRRTHMNAFFLYMFPETKEAILEKMRRESVESACVVAYSKGLKAIGASFFEFHVDQTLWVNFFGGLKDAGADTPEWPWAEHRPHFSYVTDGSSETYHEWLKAQDTDITNTDTTEDSDSVPDGMTLENLCFTYMAGGEETLVEIANHLAGLSPSGRVEVTMRYYPE